MKVTILGTGAFGIAIAKVLEPKNLNITMWTKFEREKERIAKDRENVITLPGIKILDDIKITTDLEEAIMGAEVIINALPFEAVRATINEIKPYYNNQIICSTTKGLEMEDFKTSTQVSQEILNSDRVCALLGPSFAIELATGEPISMVLAGTDKESVDIVKELFNVRSLSIEVSQDVVGVELCGALKNAIAIGSGMLYGMGAADSTKAAYITRGVKDIVKVVKSLGGEQETFYSYAGLGDLILTCMSEKSRNYSYGMLRGQGKTNEQATNELGGKTVEGVKAIEALFMYANKNSLDLDIIPKLYKIIYQEGSLDIIK